jgi:hypothetical protein
MSRLSWPVGLGAIHEHNISVAHHEVNRNVVLLLRLRKIRAALFIDPQNLPAGMRAAARSKVFWAHFCGFA